MKFGHLGYDYWDDAMMTGLYYYNGKLYYGQYDERQVSGRISCKVIKSEYVMTDFEFDKEDFAITLYDNHSFLEAETPDLQACLSVAGMLAAQTARPQNDIALKEKRLSVEAPKEFVLIYDMISDFDYFFSVKEHFIRPSELYIDKNVIPFYAKGGKPLAGLDLQSRRLAGYVKGEWTIEKGDVSFFRYCIEHILLIILEQQNIVRKGRLKGSLVSALNIERALEQNGTGNFHILKGLGIYGVAVLYDDNGTIAQVRSNGFYGDVYIGAKEQQGIDDILELFEGKINLAD